MPETREQARAEIEKKVRAAKPNGHDTGKTVELIPFADLLKPDLETRSLVKGLLNAAAVALIFGESGCGKTFFTLDLALHIAGGLDWFGRRITRGRVVYVAAEAGRSIRNRVAAFAQERCSDQSEIDFAAVVSPVDLCHLGKSDDVARLIAAIGSAQLVVIDTVSRALAGGNENAPDDMGAFVNALDLIRDKLGCAIIAVHHIGKDASRGGRGHSLLHCAVDTEIEVQRREGDVCVATVTKQRDGPSGGEIAFKLRQVELGEDQDGDPVTSCVTEPSDFTPPPKIKTVTGAAQKALEMLNLALTAKGELLPFGDIECHAVKVEVWREHLEKSGELGTGAKFRNAWKRAQEKLQKDGHVVIANGYAWPAQSSDAIPF